MSKITLKKIKGSDNILHPDSGLVFRSQKDKVVIGKYEDGEILTLDNSMVELCEKWNFKYDQDLLVEEDENEENEEIEETEEGAEEEGEDQQNEEETADVEENQDETQEESQETNDDENEEEVKQESKSEEVESSDFSIDIPENMKTSHILDLTKNFSSEIYKSFDLLHQTYYDKLTEMHNLLVLKNKNFEDLEKKYESEVMSHTNTQKDLEKLKAKFEGIKSLFN